ncbi:MAG: hypothetical protein LBG58_10080 [Planctomycetaceae bacterium]|jgi:hypothetical protein|nr:hypothetical protein [Planctomycetaceae bacterium]
MMRDAPRYITKETNSAVKYLKDFSKAKDGVKSLLLEKYGMFAHSALTSTVPKKGIKTSKFELTQ